jgi:biotin synthase-like enzyme
MVGNYLTTLNQPVEKDLQMLKDLGLDPCWDKHDFDEQGASPAHRQGGEENCKAESVAS